MSLAVFSGFRQLTNTIRFNKNEYKFYGKNPATESNLTIFPHNFNQNDIKKQQRV